MWYICWYHCMFGGHTSCSESHRLAGSFTMHEISQNTWSFTGPSEIRVSRYNCLYTATNAADVLLYLNRFDLFEVLKYKGRNC